NGNSNSMQEQPSGEIQALFEQAERYDVRGDVYHAVKLYKHLIKLAPDWHPPYAKLSQLYKLRQDWKAALHYSKKAISLNVQDQNSWWNVGIAATALKKPRLAQRVWQKFGYVQHDFPPVCVRILWGHQIEIVAVRPIDPARGLIVNIPHPASERRYQDVVLFDREVLGYNILQKKKIPIYASLGVFKRSMFHTFSCQLYDVERQDIKVLERLCYEANLGFENWSNLTQVQNLSKNLPEYYGADFTKVSESGTLLVAIAAPHQRQVEEMLANWKVISLKNFNNLVKHL
ncbi:MAG: tetratricopeptide repeat protein, partial [Saprospiraceae bacterium]